MADQDIFREGDGIEDFDDEVLEELDNTVSIIDEDGKEHVFEELDRIDLPGGAYVALAPLVGVVDEDGDDELILLRIEEEEEEVYLSPLDDDEYDEVADAFIKNSAVIRERLGISFSD